MNSKLVVLALVAAGAAYYFFKKKQAGSPKVPTSNPKNIQPAQPSQQFPWSAIFPSRVDNQNQPWAAPVVNLLNGSVPQSGYNVSQIASAGGSVIHSMADLWGMLPASSTANAGNANLQSSDSSPSDQSEEAMPGSGTDQSNLVGAAASGAGAGVNYDSSSNYDYSALIGSSSDSSSYTDANIYDTSSDDYSSDYSA